MLRSRRYRCVSVDPVFERRYAVLLSAVGTAKVMAVVLDTMTNDTRVAVRTVGRERLKGTLEAIEHMALALYEHLKGFVGVVSARHR